MLMEARTEPEEFRQPVNMAAGMAAFGPQLAAWQGRMERALAARLPPAATPPCDLHAAMRYSVLGGGKRVRPVLMLATADMLGMPADAIEGAACAVELIHAYSLVHDDLPAMDDDDLRRGRPSCHRAWGEATAILAGDALQALAFELLACDATLRVPDGVRVRLLGLLAEASGSLGMAGGQALDLTVGAAPALPELERMYALKTGALIRASVLMAAQCAPQLAPRLRDGLAAFAAAIGLAFQIQDDLIDQVADAGRSDIGVAAVAGPSYPALMGVGAALARLQALHAQAGAALVPFGSAAAGLQRCSDWLLARRH